LWAYDGLNKKFVLRAVQRFLDTFDSNTIMESQLSFKAFFGSQSPALSFLFKTTPLQCFIAVKR
jgi:hypothetical protein